MFHKIAIFVLLALVGCNTPNVNISYRPPIPIPVKLVINSAGRVSLDTTDASVVTPIGTFSIGASVSVADFDSSKDVLIILEDRNRNTQQVYRVFTGQDARIVTNGTTEIRVSADRRVVIDITNATVQLVEINGRGVQSTSSVAYRPPSASQSSIVSAQPRPQSTIVFEDDFGGATLDSSIWSLDNFVRNHVSVNGSVLRLASSGDRAPYIYTRSNPFPSSGDFRFTVKYRYSGIDVCGATIALTSAFLPPFIQGQGPSGMPNEGASKVSFFIWHEIIWYDTQSGRQNILLPGAFTAHHEVSIEYRSNRYRVTQDGAALFTSDTINARPRYIAFGNAAIQTNSCSWDSLDIDSVRVERLP